MNTIFSRIMGCSVTECFGWHEVPSEKLLCELVSIAASWAHLVMRDQLQVLATNEKFKQVLDRGLDTGSMLKEYMTLWAHENVFMARYTIYIGHFAKELESVVSKAQQISKDTPTLLNDILPTPTAVKIVSDKRLSACARTYHSILLGPCSFLTHLTEPSSHPPNKRVKLRLTNSSCSHASSLSLTQPTPLPQLVSPEAEHRKKVDVTSDMNAGHDISLVDNITRLEQSFVTKKIEKKEIEQNISILEERYNHENLHAFRTKSLNDFSSIFTVDENVTTWTVDDITTQAERVLELGTCIHAELQDFVEKKVRVEEKKMDLVAVTSKLHKLESKMRVLMNWWEQLEGMDF